MELQDFVPQTGSFTLDATKKAYRLRKLSLLDEAWLKTRFGDDAALSKIFTDLNIFAIAEIAYHQLFNEDREDFLEKTVTLIDDSGKKAEMKLGGYKLLFSLIAGPQEKQDVISALLETIGISRPMVSKFELDRMKEKEEYFKKKVNQYLPVSPSIGQESSTSSVANMDGI